MKVAIVGTGYVGLPTGVGFAELGHDVVCIDAIPEKIESLNAGKVTLFENGLEELLRKNLANGRLIFTTNMQFGIRGAEFVIIAVGTPPHPVTKEADMKHINAAVEDLAPHLSDHAVVATKSTVPIGTGDKIEEIIQKNNPSVIFDVVSMPEFLREGFAVHDFFYPDRVIVGTNSKRPIPKIQELYSVFKTSPHILFTDRRSSELIKYASNAFLAMKIHYINEMAVLCEKIGANVYDVARGMGLDSRIGNAFLNPGPGYGGSCFPKDTSALAYMARNNDIDLSLVEAVIIGNVIRKSKMAIKILDAVKDIENPKIAVWGLAFKDGTDDVRESPAVQIIEELITRKVNVTAFDPKAMETARALLGDTIVYAEDAVAAAAGADVLAVLTEWEDFRKISLSDLCMRNKRIVDMRNCISPDCAMVKGYRYWGIGR